MSAFRENFVTIKLQTFNQNKVYQNFILSHRKVKSRFLIFVAFVEGKSVEAFFFVRQNVNDELQRTDTSECLLQLWLVTFLYLH